MATIIGWFLYGGIANIAVQIITGEIIWRISKGKPNMREAIGDLLEGTYEDVFSKWWWNLISAVCVFALWPLGIIVSIALIVLTVITRKIEDESAE